jgi:tetratricopeptide (TPR) repeat protein
MFWILVSRKGQYMMKSAVLVSVICFSVGVWAQTASESDKTKARDLYKQAQIHYRTGDLEKAVSEFKASYELFPAPETLFNLAQTHRFLKNYEKSIFFYRQYLSTSKSNDVDQKVIQDRIVELEALLQAQQRAQNAPVIGAEPPAQRAQVTNDAHNQPALVVAASPTPTRQPIYRRWWLWTGVAVAVAAIGIGLGVGLSEKKSEYTSPGVTF